MFEKMIYKKDQSKVFVHFLSSNIFTFGFFIQDDVCWYCCLYSVDSICPL